MPLAALAAIEPREDVVFAKEQVPTVEPQPLRRVSPEIAGKRLIRICCQ